MYIYTIFYLPVVNSYWQLVVNSDFTIDNQLSIATSNFMVSNFFMQMFNVSILCMHIISDI